MSLSELKSLWREAQWTLQVFVGGSVVLGLVNAVIRHDALVAVVTLLGLVVSYFLLRGIRWVWFLLIAVAAVYLVGFALEARAISAITNAVSLLLLLASPTRRYFSRSAPANAS